MIMMLVTIRHLGGSFSLVPQARSVVQTGPYRWIKHPLYLAEEIVIVGVVLQYLTPATVVVLVLHIGVQVCRILYEEDLLRRNIGIEKYFSYIVIKSPIIKSAVPLRLLLETPAVNSAQS